MTTESCLAVAYGLGALIAAPGLVHLAALSRPKLRRWVWLLMVLTWPVTLPLLVLIGFVQWFAEKWDELSP